jgi:flagellar biosynthesis protein FlhF
MRIKKYTALTLQEGKAKIMSELGEDAIILSSRTINPPEDPTRSIFEIVAAIDEEPLRPRKKLSFVGKTTQNEMKTSTDESPSVENLVELANMVQGEFSSIKDLIKDINDNIKYRYSSLLTPVLGDLFRTLRKQGLTEDFALKIAGKLSSKNFAEDYVSAIGKAREYALEHIRLMDPLKKAKERKVAIFIGPTGNGKTSTIVKLAIVAKLVMDAKVLVISADTNKIGGAEQLQTYASIAQIPFEAAYSPKELIDQIDRHKDVDLIFVDTTGRNPKNQEHIDELILLSRAANADYTYLVQSATVSDFVLKEIISDFSLMTPNGLILTKIDESPHIGNIIEALQEKNIPIAYITTGQKIPEDIEPATKEKLGKLLIPDLYENNSRGRND